ncbi:MAG: CRTAC1 family protein, partial [Bryobacteraceae bacterium]
HNLGNGKFEEAALLAGVALPDHGRPVASMGADFRDYDNDGLPDLSVTALASETFPLFRNMGKGLFTDATYASRLGPLSIRHSGWGNGLFDLNNDGWKDLFTADSHVNDLVEQFEPARYKEPNGVFMNSGDGKFTDVSAAAGQDTVRAHRGSAYADLNGDGKIDVVVSCLGESAEVWENVSPEANHWMLLRLEGTRSNRDGIGARIRIGDQTNEMTSAVGYASSSHAGVHFGLGAMEKIPKIEIRWPSGAHQVLTDVKADQTLTVREPAPAQ